MRSIVLALVLFGMGMARRLPSSLPRRLLPGARRARLRRDQQRLVAELPEALERLAASLRAGLGILAGLASCTDGAGPLGRDLARVARDVDAGASIPAALGAWRVRRGLPEVGVVAAALEVAVSAGGRAAGALDGLALALRDAADTRAEVSAQSAQARLSALVVGLAPAAAVALTATVDPGTAAVLVTTPAGRACLVTGLVLMAAAALWMARILRAA